MRKYIISAVIILLFLWTTNFVGGHWFKENPFFVLYQAFLVGFGMAYVTLAIVWVGYIKEKQKEAEKT